MKISAVVAVVMALGLSGCLVSSSGETSTAGDPPPAASKADPSKDQRIAELEREIADLRETYDELLAQIEKYEKRRGTGWRSDDWSDVLSLITTVTGVDPEKNEVTFGVGSDDGVKVGFRFTVYRGDRYVTMVVIDRVEKERSVGHSRKELEAKLPEVGDGARTRW